ncbi:cyclin-A3-2-like [Panicum miliaceum]|uniref:Cyclin-A3-2-like n=1 Tax=Panicum miliaceum TaxID=4540 RepID=A0A3L6STY5_PANMI|nr:cyclin-A3-2-like [Panicum miliaceum]
MADKENAPAAAAGPRLTRSAAKRAAKAAAGGGGGPPAKRKRVALGELPALAANSVALRAPPPRPVKPARGGGKAARPGKLVPRPAAAPAVAADAEAERCGSSSPPRAAGAADPDRESSASTSPPRATAAAADPDRDSSASSSPPPRAAGPGAPIDPQLCGSYASDVYTYLRALEVEPRRRPRSDYIEAVQSDVTANMRTILVDWLVEVAEEYKLVADTLYLAISYIDRFLSANVLSRDKLQLLGVAAMLIAAKYEEISLPHAEDFCYITDNTYTKQELLKMESDILKLLQFELGNPTIKTFLRRFTRSAHEDKKRSILLMEFLGSYLAELSLLDYGCLRFLPSVVAASVMFVARLTIDPDVNPWNKKLQKVTGYKVSELKDCIIAIHDLQLNRKCSSLTAIRDKYKQHKFKFVSTLLPPVVIPTSYFEDIAE